jgi:phenylpropionate dioxygenase-like ring-hydroxylating dioxygenase large terminal subunit
MNLTDDSQMPVDWAPVMASEHVPPNQIIQGFLHGQELAIWRNAQGDIQVWENRCPHRGTRFTLGRIIDGQLSCGYHGWRFAGGGQCSFIPALPKLIPPKSIAAKTYSAVERYGMVWAALGQPANEVPAIPALSDQSRRTIFCRSFVTYAAAGDVITRLQPAYTSSGPGVLIDTSAPELTSVLLVQPMASQKSVVHVWLSCMPAAGEEGQLRQQCITRFKRQRRGIESALAA